MREVEFRRVEGDTAEDRFVEERVKGNKDKQRWQHVRLLLELSYLAYYRLHADECVCPDWFRPFAEAIFESGKDAKEVRQKALKSKNVPSRIAFDTELSRLRTKIKTLRDKMWKRMYAFDSNGGRVLSPKEVLEREWDELALWVGDHRMHDIRYNVVRGLLDSLG